MCEFANLQNMTCSLLPSVRLKPKSNFGISISDEFYTYNFGGCNLQNSFNKCRKFLLSSLETFFCRNWKNVGMSFWANVMLRQSHVWASRASPAQKPQGLRVVCSKKFSMATFFVFWVT